MKIKSVEIFPGFMIEQEGRYWRPEIYVITEDGKLFYKEFPRNPYEDKEWKEVKIQDCSYSEE